MDSIFSHIVLPFNTTFTENERCGNVQQIWVHFLGQNWQYKVSLPLTMKGEAKVSAV